MMVLRKSLVCASAVLLAALVTRMPQAAAQARDSAFSMPAADEYSAIIERPLFSPGRKPPEGEAAAPAPESNEAEGQASREIILTGTATDQADRAAAILHDTAEGVNFQVRVGDKVEGWTIKSIQPRAVTLSTETEEVTVTLDDPTFPSVIGDGDR